MSLNEKVCIITGGNSGIGLATAKRFAEDGAKVAIVGRSEETLASASKEIDSLGAEVQSFAINVGEPEAVRHVVNSVTERHGAVDVLVNCAGGGSLRKRMLTTTPDDMQSVIESNLLGTIYFVQAALPSMLEARSGTIINVSSGASRTPGLLGGMIYGAAKAGVNNITDFINAEFVNSGVRACTVVPGEVDTPALTRNRPVPVSDEARKGILAPEDLAETIHLMASMPQRANISELVIRPTMRRDTSAETPKE